MILKKKTEKFFADKTYSFRWFRSYLLIILGSMIMSAGFAFFAEPFKIVPGGVYGTAIVIHHIFGLPTGTVGLIINIPLFLLGIWILGPRFGTKTFIGTILTSVFIDFFNSLDYGCPVDDIMLASIVSGVLIGAGLALIFKSKATTGGSDIVAQIANKYTKLPIGQLLIAIDSVIVFVGVAAFKDLSLALYAFITIFITGKVLDGILLGGSHRKAVFIISEKSDAIKEFILKRLNRGGTFFNGQGMYHGNDKKIIYAAVTHRELVALMDYVNDVDKDAFMSVFNTNQVYGKGFLALEED